LTNDKFDLNSKILFSGCNSISLDGKLMEMEELYLLSQASIEYNLFKSEFILNTIYNELLNEKFVSVKSIFFPKDRYINSLKVKIEEFANSINIENNKLADYVENEANYDVLVYGYINLLNNYEKNITNNILFFDSYNEFYSDKINIFQTYNNKFNKIFTKDSYLDLIYFYRRRYNKLSYFFNPYIELFNDIFCPKNI
jgi:hypothetical protein